MKSSIAAATTLSLAATAVAQVYNITSAPFQLVINSEDGSTYQNATLESCHIGAAIEDLCVNTGAPSAYSTYNFNTTADGPISSGNFGEQGYLTWRLPAAGGVDYSYPFGITVSLSSNVALPNFGLGDTTLVAWDSNDLLNIQSYLDNTVNPPDDDTNHAYYRWYICENNYHAYVYPSLSWVLGDKEPENPSCTKVSVSRRFV